MRWTSLALVGLAALALFCLPAHAADTGDQVDIHGFGGWSYGTTDGNTYLSGSEEGEYSNVDFYLNISAQPSEKLSISAQVGWFNDPVSTDVDFDFAFAEYAFSDAAKVRVGRVKHPFGIYGELLRVGTLRPFLSLPQSIYGPFGFIGNGYNGLGVTGRFFTEGGWSFGYDVYGGQLQDTLEIQNILLFPFPGFTDPTYLNDGASRFEEHLNDMVGARIDIGAPVAGLHFGLSGYTGQLDSELFADADRTILGAHVEYQGHGFLLRSEYMNFEQLEKNRGGPTDVLSDSYYLEAAYRVTDHWEVAARYDEMDQEIRDPNVPALPPFIEASTQHQDLAFGLNYWFSAHFVLKTSYHLVEGLRFARSNFDDDPMGVLLGGDFDDETRLFQFGAQFSF